MTAADGFAQGWYADPRGGAGLRWWDGAAWTDHVATEPGGVSAQAGAERTGPLRTTAAPDVAPGTSTEVITPRDDTDAAGTIPAVAPSPADRVSVVLHKSPTTGSGDPATSASPLAAPETAGRPSTPASVAQAFPAQQDPAPSSPVEQFPARSWPLEQYGEQPAGASAFAQADQVQHHGAQPWGAQPWAQPAAGQLSGGAAAPAAWLQDPHGPGLRWWDGTAWTAHTAPTPYPANGGNTVNVNGGSTTVVVGGARKSVGVAFLLTFLFGPIGLLYATVAGGLVMIGVELFLLILGLVTFGLAWLLFGFTWVICIVWGCVAAGKQPAVQVVHH